MSNGIEKAKAIYALREALGYVRMAVSNLSDTGEIESNMLDLLADDLQDIEYKLAKFLTQFD